MIRKLAPYTKGYRVWIFLGVLCSAGEAVLELLLPKAMSQIVDVGIANGDKAYILAMGLKMILMALASLVMGVGAAALAAKAGMGFGANVRAAEYAQVQRFSFANIEHFSTASLITRLTNDVSSVQMTLMMGMRMLVRAPVMLITALVMALTISLQLSQVFLVVLPLLLLLVAIVIRYVGPFFTALQKSTDDLNLVVQEDLNAIRVVKSFVREDREQEKFAQRSDTLRDTAERAYSFVVLFVPLVTLIMGGTIMAIMWLGGHYVVGSSMLSGDLIAFFTYASEILMSLMMVAMVMMVLTRSIACGKRIVEVLEEQPEMMIEIFREVDNPRLRMCLDVGHVNAYSPVPVEEWVSACAEFLSHFHIHNNDGSQDTHCAPGEGTISMAALLRQAQTLCPEATFTLEVLQAAPAVSWMLEERILEG